MTANILINFECSFHGYLQILLPHQHLNKLLVLIDMLLCQNRVRWRSISYKYAKVCAFLAMLTVPHSLNVSDGISLRSTTYFVNAVPFIHSLNHTHLHSNSHGVVNHALSANGCFMHFALDGNHGRTQYPIHTQ